VIRRRTMSASERRDRMASIRRENTKPEIIVRRILWRLGARYRLHAKKLPGRPDVVLRRRRLVIFVHGCLWHLHDGCPLARVPKSRPDYWPLKLAGNRARDQRTQEELRRAGWKVEVVWECETRDLKSLSQRLAQTLASSR
jgi:DNA mismatch endonuclease Vsr